MNGTRVQAAVPAAWTPVLQDLLDLDRAGALPGILAIIAERGRMVRDGWEHDVPARVAGFALAAGDYPAAAAMLAAEIDRQEAPS